MPGKTMPERIERLETVYVATQEMFATIQDHLSKQNGHIDELLAWKIRVMAVMATLGFITSGSLAFASIAIAVATGFL